MVYLGGDGMVTCYERSHLLKFLNSLQGAL